VSHPWAGKNWGAISIPRIGQEVIVDFLEGDPDQPIITGRVYNAEQMPPHKLPAGKVSSGIKSNSTKGGGGYNEFTMDDTKGKERVSVHAQYDMGTTVEHDDTLTVHRNRLINVDGTHTETIDKDTTIRILTGRLNHDVVANIATFHVKGAVAETYEDTQTTLVTNDVVIVSKAATILIDAAKEITLHTGSSTLDMNANGTVVLDAAKEIMLHSGSSILDMTSEGTIQLNGVNVSISGTQQVMAGVSTQTVTCDNAKVTTSGADITATAVGVHEISGALVKIN
jgi:type VI secretion system secreted protein VgrG